MTDPARHMNERDFDFICSLVMPYKEVSKLSWKAVRMRVGDEADVRRLILADRWVMAFKREWRRRRKTMRQLEW